MSTMLPEIGRCIVKALSNLSMFWGNSSGIKRTAPALLRVAGKVPPLLVLELTYRCPHRCRVCFHTGKRGKNTPDMPMNLVRLALDKAQQEGVQRVRLTGGEPLLYPQLDTILREIKTRGMEAWLNTAASTPPPIPWQSIGLLVDDILLPLREEEQLPALSSVIAELRVAGNPRIRLGAVLLPDVIPRLPDLVTFARSHDTPLELYRVMSTPGHNTGSCSNDLLLAVALLDRLNSACCDAARARIANAIPFCLSIDRQLIARNSFGGRFDDGRSRLIIGPDGAIRPSYPMQLVVGNILNDSLAKAWSHPDLLTLHASASLPATCRHCQELATCMGGSRYEAMVVRDNTTGMDPLAAIRTIS